MATAARERVEFSNELMLLLRLCACEGVSVFFFRGGGCFLFFVSGAGGEMFCKEMVRVGWGGEGVRGRGEGHIYVLTHTHTSCYVAHAQSMRTRVRTHICT